MKDSTPSQYISQSTTAQTISTLQHIFATHGPTWNSGTTCFGQRSAIHVNRIRGINQSEWNSSH